MAAIFATAIDQLEPERWKAYYARAGEAAGKPSETGPSRTLFMDTYAMQAAWRMKTHGATQRQIARTSVQINRERFFNGCTHWRPRAASGTNPRCS